jgi:hypothetical protein
MLITLLIFKIDYATKITKFLNNLKRKRKIYKGKDKGKVDN